MMMVYGGIALAGVVIIIVLCFLCKVIVSQYFFVIPIRRKGNEYIKLDIEAVKGPAEPWIEDEFPLPLDSSTPREGSKVLPKPVDFIVDVPCFCQFEQIAGNLTDPILDRPCSCEYGQTAPEQTDETLDRACDCDYEHVAAVQDRYGPFYERWDVMMHERDYVMKVTRKAKKAKKVDQRKRQREKNKVSLYIQTLRGIVEKKRRKQERKEKKLKARKMVV